MILKKLLLWASLFLFSHFRTGAATVAYYRFEDGAPGGIVSRVTDSGPNHLDGVVNSAQPLYFSSDVAPYPAAGVLSLNASGDHNFARVPHNNAFVLQGSWTVELFLKVNNPHGSFGGSTGGPELYTIATKQNNPGFGSYLAAWSINYSPKSGHALADIGFGSDAGVGVESMVSVNDGKWHHLALILTRKVRQNLDRLSLFLDGSLQSLAFTNMPNIYYGTQPLYIGAGNFGNDPNGTGDFRRNFDGYIDELRISDASLSPPNFLIFAPSQTPSVRLEIAPAASSQMKLSWLSGTGMVYQLQFSPTTAGNWSNLDPAQQGSGNIISLFDSTAPSNRFYRLLISN